MKTSNSRSFPVTVTRLPVVRCQLCGRTLAHRKGEAGQVLTAHYAREHADAVQTGGKALD